MFDDSIKVRLGCALLVAVFMGGPYLWIAMQGDGGPGESSRVPAVVGEVDTLLHRKHQPAEALAACRTALAASPEPETRALLEERIPACLSAIFSARAQAKDWAACEPLHAEIAESHGDSPYADSVRRNWRNHRDQWLRECIARGDAATADRLAAAMLADPEWRTVAYDHPFYEVLSRRWREAWDAGGVEAAERVFAEVLADERTNEHHKMLKDHAAFLEMAILDAWKGGREEEAARRFAALDANARGRATRMSLRGIAAYVEGRMDRLARAGDEAGAKKFFDLLLECAPDSERQPNRGLLPAIYMRLRESRWRRATAAGDFETADRVFRDRDPHPNFVDRNVDRAQRAEFLLLRWRAEKDAGKAEAARAALLEAVTDFGDVADPAALSASMRAEWTAAEMMENGDARMAKKDAAGALACFRAVADWPDSGVPEAELAPRLDRAMRACADRISAAAQKYVDFRGYARAEELYRALLFERPSFREPAEAWRQAGGRLLAMQSKWADQLSDNSRFEDAGRVVERALRETAIALWRRQAEADPAAAWATVPPEVARRIELGEGGADPTGRLAAAADLAARGVWTVPEAAPALAMAAVVRERSALARAESALHDLEWRRTREEALDTLREVLRLHPGSKAHALIKERLEGKLRSVGSSVEYAAGSPEGLGTQRAAEDFEELSLCLGFYVAEFGPLAAKDPFRDFLRNTLGKAANLAGNTNPLTRVFFLSLLADALPDEEAGRSARVEALAKGLKIMADLPAHAPPAPQREAASLIPQHSAQCIENRTPYHMLVFVRGPEEFYVRLDPFRRGVVVLLDGEYDTAVIVAREEVRPYRGKRSYAGVTRMEGYHISRSGPDRPGEEGKVDVTGEFRLLRAPESAGPVIAHPDSGWVFPAQPR